MPDYRGLINGPEQGIKRLRKKGEIKLQDVTFSINVYDSDGDRLDNSIFLHYDRVSIKIGSMQDLSNLIEKLTDIQREIKENYPDQNYF